MKATISVCREMDFFDSVAEEYEKYRLLSGYYHAVLANIYLSSIPPRSDVVEFGCGTGSLLRRLAAANACGIDFSAGMISECRKRLGHNVRLICENFSRFVPDMKYDYAVISNTLEYVYDIAGLLSKAADSLNEDGKLIVTSVNPVWKPLLALASRLSIRTPDIEKNFLTNKDVVNFLETSDFEIIEEGVVCAIPLYVPFIVPALNFLISQLPLVRHLGMIQYVIAKKKRAPKDYTCSIVIPCHNESGNITELILKAPKIGLSTELIFVDDGSDDGTAREVNAALRRDIEVKLISYHPHRNKAHAVQAGFEAAKGDILMILDADMSVPPEELERFYGLLAAGRADFVNGTRLIYPMENKAMKVANYFGNKMFCLLVSWIIGQRVSDTLCGTKALFKKDFGHITMGHDPWGDFDIIFGAAKLRLKTREVAVHSKERRARRYTIKAFNHAATLMKACYWGLRKIKLPMAGICPHEFFG